MQEGVANAAPSVASMPAKVPVVLALFSADSINIPDVPMFTIEDKEEFNTQWIRNQLAPLDLCNMQRAMDFVHERPASSGSIVRQVNGRLPWVNQVQQQRRQSSIYTVRP